MPLSIDPKTAALVLIDLQNGIVSRPLAPHSGEQVVQRSVTLANALAKAGGTIVRVHVAFSPDEGDRLKQPVDESMSMPPGGLPPGWSEFAPAIAALNPALSITKRQWGAFHGTELDMQLRRRGITTIVLGGIATNFGVEQTAREAWQHNYAVVLVEDACATMDEAMHRFAIEKILPRLSRIVKTQDVLKAIGG